MDAPKLTAEQRAAFQTELDRKAAAQRERLAAKPSVDEFFDVLKPLGSRVLLLWITDERTKGGLHVPDQAQERTRAEIYALGPQANGDLNLEIGCIVLVASYAGRKLSVEIPREVEGATVYDKREGQIVPAEYIEAVIERRCK